MMGLVVVCLSQEVQAESTNAEISSFKKKAEQGDTKAQFMLGLIYYNGEGVSQDYQQAVHWFTKAAEQGLARAQYNLGFMSENGEGVPKDYQQAV